MRATVIGAGVAGLACAIELMERGATVDIVERAPSLGAGACSWYAGGMLAPWCEAESAEPAVARQGEIAPDWWAAHFAGTQRQGTLVVAPPRDAGDLARFAERTTHHRWLDEAGIAGLEPDLCGRFRRALYFAEEAHLDPRQALLALADRLAARGAAIRFGADGREAASGTDVILDCRGFAARDRLPDLRGVRGEMIVLRTREIALKRPVRLLHPRIPIYVVPRGEGVFMVGATMIESDHRGPVTARSAADLINGAYTLHPAFGEAEILEMSADIRPAFPDNLPRIMRQGRTISVNGLFRHGFLLSPAFARQAADLAFSLSETGHDHHPQRQSA
jgi:glycine oxidase